MRVLGFPKQISLESFRTPNWEVMEECLRWLAARVEPDAELGGSRHSMEQRVALVTHAISLFVRVLYVHNEPRKFHFIMFSLMLDTYRFCIGLLRSRHINNGAIIVKFDMDLQALNLTWIFKPCDKKIHLFMDISIRYRY